MTMSGGAAPGDEKPVRTMSVFHSAILDSDGVHVNVGYLSLFWMMAVVLNVIPVMCIGALLQWWKTNVFPLQELGVGVGAVCTGFGVALGALGVFVWGDRKNQSQPAQAL